MKKIQVLGTGCPKTHKLAVIAEAAAVELGIEFELELVRELKRIVSFGVVLTPALAVNGEVVAMGRVTSLDEMKLLLQGSRRPVDDVPEDDGMPYTLVFSCSGAADVGHIADHAARELSHEGTAAMCCTPALAAGVSSVLERAANASQIVVIDGCGHGCARKILAKAGITDCHFVELGEEGLVKGRSPVNDERVGVAVDAAKRALEGCTTVQRCSI